MFYLASKTDSCNMKLINVFLAEGKTHAGGNFWWTNWIKNPITRELGKNMNLFFGRKKINISSLSCSSSKHTNQLIVIA